MVANKVSMPKKFFMRDSAKFAELPSITIEILDHDL